jgi:hypothetical protein
MAEINWTLRTFRLDELTDYYKNPRSLSEKEFRQLKTSLDKFGMIDKPIVNLDAANTIIGGHQRKHVLEASGVKECECWIPDRELSEKEVEELNIRLNKNTGSWDFDCLANEFELDDLLEWGFDKGELDLDLWADEAPEDVEPQIDKAEELQSKWNVQPGQLWQLGEHKIICGDCTDRGVIERVIGSEKYSVLTDPPYNIGFNYESIDDKMAQEKYAEFCNLWFENVVNDAAGTIFSPGPHNERFYPIPRDRGFWLKRNATAGASCFHLRLIEPLLFYGNFVSKRNTDLFEYSSGFTSELKSARVAAGVPDNYAPAKSMPLWEELLGMLEKDTLVLDVFSGNGTTIIACERLGRKCRAVEISPAYVAVAIQRWVDVTGKEPVLLDT